MTPNSPSKNSPACSRKNSGKNNAMEIKKGIGVSAGVAISAAIVLDADNLVIPRRKISADRIEAEFQRLTQSLDQTVRELSAQRDELLANQRKEIAGILDFHIGVLKDKS